MRGTIATSVVLIVLTAREALHLDTPWPLGVSLIVWVVVMSILDGVEFIRQRTVKGN